MAKKFNLIKELDMSAKLTMREAHLLAKLKIEKKFVNKRKKIPMNL